jgi:phosphatidylglycerol:prolipoprotein diacylglycerol transferase
MREELQLQERDRPYRDHSAGTNVPIFGFGAMLFLGFVAGAWTAGRRGARIGYPPEMIWDIGIWLFIAGVIGCRIFYCIQYGSRLFYNDVGGHAVLKSLPGLVLAAVNLPDGGLVYYGGIPTGLLAAIWICRKRNLNLLALGDVIIPSLFLGMAFGRIGCFLNGCCYGDRCDLPWGVQFPMGSVPDMALVLRGFVGADQDLTVRLHPTQLYSSLDGLFLFLLTHAYFPFRPRNGAVIALGALTYPLTRFAIESLRADELGQFNTSLTISQWVSILTFAVGIVFAIWLSRRPKLSPPPRVSTVGA